MVSTAVFHISGNDFLIWSGLKAGIKPLRACLFSSLSWIRRPLPAILLANINCNLGLIYLKAFGPCNRSAVALGLAVKMRCLLKMP